MLKTKHKKIFSAGLLIAFLATAVFFVFNPLKNLAKGEAQTIFCNREIPIGEALEGAASFTGRVRNNIFSAEQLADQEIAAVQDLISAVQSCDPDKCKPSCEITTTGGGEGAIAVTECAPNSCTGKICPQSRIESAYQAVDAAYKSIVSVKESTKSLIEDKNSSWIYGSQKYQNQGQINIVEAMLNKSREAFDSCYLSPDEWNDYFAGKKVGKKILSCESGFVFKNQITQECKDICDKNIASQECAKCLGCSSPGNYFCCDIK